MVSNKFPILLSVLILHSLLSFSQNITEFNDCKGMDAYTVMYGDTIVMKCDTSFLLNKNVFYRFKNVYDKKILGSREFTSIINSYKDVVANKDSALESKEMYYQAILHQLNSMSDSSKKIITTVNTQLISITSDLNTSKTKLTETQQLLDESTKILATERKKANGKLLKFGLGGMIIGALVAVLITAQ
jgi:mevalonate kinase